MSTVTTPVPAAATTMVTATTTTVVAAAASVTMETAADFSEDPFKNYRYEDPFLISDPFQEEKEKEKGETLIWGFFLFMI